MKKNLLFLVFIGLHFQNFAQHIDDPNFAYAIKLHCPSCIDTANNLTSDAQKARSLTISIHEISDLKGIEGFGSLTTLNCTNNKLTALPTNLPSTLTYINVEYNQIKKLPKLPESLRTLNCSDNLLTDLPNLPSDLRIFDCSNNQIATLPALPNSLTTLFCSNNLLTSVPNLPSTLEGLICAYNRIKTIPVLPSTLIRLSCQYTDVKCLPFLPNNLIYLDISKTIVCVPNIVTTLGINLYEGFASKVINLPICNDLRPPPCDTFPRSVTSKDTSKTLSNAQIPVKITVFPNPTVGSLKIKCSNCVVKKVSVFNALGQLIFETNTSIFDISNLGAALYFIQVETVSGEKIIEKVIRI